MTRQSPAVLADGFFFLEGPRWHDGRLWMADIGGAQVVALSEQGQWDVVAPVPGRPSGIGFLPDGTAIVVSIDDRRLLRIKDGQTSLHADLAPVAPSMINDMVVDRQGRAYVGSIGYDFFKGEAAKPGAIVLALPDGSVRVVAEGLTFPNGSVVTADNRLVVAESFGNRLSSYDIAADGSLSNHRVEAELGGSPDGICLDVDGGIWVAMIDQGFARVKDGKIVDRIATGDHLGIACQLGGADGRTLFLLTFKGTIADIGKNPGARVETVRVEAPAAGSP